MNYKRLETFVWVATLGSFRKAAERLHTTQPAISARISGLEEELGVKLFEREGGSSPIILTPKAKNFCLTLKKSCFNRNNYANALRQTQLIQGYCVWGFPKP